MSSGGSRSKGIAGEREIIEHLIARMVTVELALGPRQPARHSANVKRNTLQSDRGGFDVSGLPLLAVEIKRQERLDIAKAWAQCERQAKRHRELTGEALLPVLFYRPNRKPWRCVTYAALARMDGSGIKWTVADILADDFLSYFETLYFEAQTAALDARDARELPS